MYRIALCDDEEHILQNLKKLIHDYCARNGIDVIIDISINGLGLIEENKAYHAIFLDIEMIPETGIQLAKKIRKSNKDSKIIFVTNFSDYKNHAFDVRAFDYIEKPINTAKLIKTLEDLFINYAAKKNTVICLNTDEGTVSLDSNEILYLEYISRKVHVITYTNKYSISQSLSSMYLEFSKYKFEYTHKAYIVNMRCIKKIVKFDILLDNGSTIPLAQKKAHGFKTVYYNYLHNTYGTVI